MRDAVTVIAEHLATWEIPFVERDVFGCDDPERIAGMIEAFVRAELGASVAGYLFQTASVSSVHGIVLDDGREIVIKAKPPAETNPDLKFDRATLEAIFAAQRHLHAAGFPCPEPLLGPTALGHGLATVETYLAPGEPATRAVMARGLVEHMRLLEALHAPALRHFAVPPDRLFPQPHNKMFHPTDEPWVCEIATRARAIAEAEPSPLQLGHCDWRVEHVKMRGDAIVATYDWDSLAALPETRIVGIDAHGHTADWSQDVVRKTPTYDQIVEFIDEYEHARGRPFAAGERRGTRAWAAYFIAYGAWISITPGEAWPADSWAGVLADCGERLLR